MPIPVTQIHILRLLMQIDAQLGGLQRDMRRNAGVWRSAAVAQSVPQPTLAEWMTSAGNAYQNRLGTLTTLQSNAAIWNRVRDLYITLGGTAAEFTNIVNPMSAVASGLMTGDKSTYALIVAGCDQILTAINAPPNLWTE